jgi:transcriptional antiterminator Rof (Rho-off)
MNQNPYRPIACDLHETYQLAAMKSSQVDLEWWVDSGERLQARIRVADVFTQSQAEYLRAITITGEAVDIRLDRIISAFWAASGKPLGS